MTSNVTLKVVPRPVLRTLKAQQRLSVRFGPRSAKAEEMARNVFDDVLIPLSEPDLQSNLARCYVTVHLFVVDCLYYSSQAHCFSMATL